MGITQGLLARMVADAAPEDLRGTAYGVFNLVGGIALLAASAIAGFLWDRFGAAATFQAGAGFCALTLVGLTGCPALQPPRRAPPARRELAAGVTLHGGSQPVDDVRVAHGHDRGSRRM